MRRPLSPCRLCWLSPTSAEKIRMQLCSVTHTCLPPFHLLAFKYIYFFSSKGATSLLLIRHKIIIKAYFFLSLSFSSFSNPLFFELENHLQQLVTVCETPLCHSWEQIHTTLCMHIVIVSNLQKGRSMTDLKPCICVVLF